MSRVLITNNGPHPPETWAMTTAEQIFDISALAGENLFQAQRFQLGIAEVLMPHHERIQKAERGKLTEDINNLTAPHEVDNHMDKIIEDIVALANGTPWQAHFARPDVQAAVRHVVGTHIITAQHVERLWHADRNPDSGESQTYRSQFQAIE